MKVKVLLLQNVTKLWNKWDIVEVSAAYARNVLIKQWKGKIADKATIKAYEAKMKKKNQQQEELKIKINKAIDDIKNNWLCLYVSASSDGHLYEKVDIRHIQDEFVRKYWFKPSEKEIDFPQKKVHKLWDYEFFYKIEGKKIPLKLKVLTK